MKTNVSILKNFIKIWLLAVIFTACSPFGKISVINIRSAQLNWNNQNYDFGSLNLGSTTNSTFTLTNNGNNIINNCSSVVLSDSVNFSILSSNCNNVIMNPGESCQVQIESHPQTVGSHNLTISRLCTGDISTANLLQMPTATATVVAVQVMQNLNFREKFLKDARADHTSTLLQDGKILVIGGSGNIGYLNSVELYDSVLNKWTIKSALTDERTKHTSTLLSDGKILVIGGISSTGILSSVELYDPILNTWTIKTALTEVRYGHTSTLFKFPVLLYPPITKILPFESSVDV